MDELTVTTQIQDLKFCFPITGELTIRTTVTGEARNNAIVEVLDGTITLWSATVTQFSPTAVTPSPLKAGTTTLDKSASFKLTIPTEIQVGNVFLQGTLLTEEQNPQPIDVQVAHWKLDKPLCADQNLEAFAARPLQTIAAASQLVQASAFSPEFAYMAPIVITHHLVPDKLGINVTIPSHLSRQRAVIAIHNKSTLAWSETLSPDNMQTVLPFDIVTEDLSFLRSSTFTLTVPSNGQPGQLHLAGFITTTAAPKRISFKTTLATWPLTSRIVP